MFRRDICFLFGAMSAATDPVAVVALLGELGAPESLGVLVEGESLINDGSAFVAFLVMIDVINGDVVICCCLVCCCPYQCSLLALVFL